MGIYSSAVFYGVRWAQKSPDGSEYYPIYIKMWSRPMRYKEWEEVVAAYYAIPESDRATLLYYQYTEVSETHDTLLTDLMMLVPITQKQFESAIALNFPAQ
jgi:hypothetical protein